ncbi:hypothetical protein CsSME_00035156 [Camellia sinensis var. sinensis]
MKWNGKVSGKCIAWKPIISGTKIILMNFFSTPLPQGYDGGGGGGGGDDGSFRTVLPENHVAYHVPVSVPVPVPVQCTRTIYVLGNIVLEGDGWLEVWATIPGCEVWIAHVSMTPTKKSTPYKLNGCEERYTDYIGELLSVNYDSTGCLDDTFSSS